MTHLLAWVVVGLLSLLTPPGARANFMCEVIGRCRYEGVPFRFTVVDTETRQPLADVHALAEWVLYGPHGRNGPLMVQDAVSGHDGVLAFPAWGPIPGPRTGLVLNLDPAVTLFKPGYKTRLIQNAYPEDMTETTRVRRFGQDGETLALEPFRGTMEAWVAELRKAAYPGFKGRVTDEQLRPFRAPYRNRLRRISLERDKVGWPRNVLEGFFWSVARDLKFYEGE